MGGRQQELSSGEMGDNQIKVEGEEGGGNPIQERKFCGSGATIISTASPSLCPRIVVNNNNNNNNNNNKNNNNNNNNIKKNNNNDNNNLSLISWLS